MRLIDADALIEIIKNEKGDNDEHCRLCLDAMAEIVVSQPTIEAVPVVHGYNNNQNFNEVDEFCCSECGLHLEDWSRRVYDKENDDEFWVEYAFKYCPECGAKIKGGGK